MWTSLFIFLADTCSVKTFFGIPPWYKYLVSSGRMAPNKVTQACELVGKLQWSDFSLIAIALLDMALRLSGLVAIVFIIYGGFQYVTSDGQPDKTKDAQTTIINALVGLAIALVATAMVSFIGNRLG
jgi:hypothetical protein